MSQGKGKADNVASRAGNARKAVTGGLATVSPEQILLQNMTEGVAELDAEGRILSVNQAFTQIFGYRPEEMLNRQAAALIAEAYREAFLERLRACLSAPSDAPQGSATSPEGSTRAKALTLQGVHKQGQSLNLQLRLVSRPGSPGARAYGFFLDLSHAERVALELEAMKTSYWALSETVTDPILQINEQLTILFANSAVESVFGYSRGELLHQGFELLFPPAVYQRYRDIFRKYFVIDAADREASRLNHSVEVLGQNRAKDIIPLEISFGNSKDVHGQRILTCIVRDITQRKKAERKLRYLAYHDKLTELGNRDLFYVILSQFLSHVKRYQDTLGALLFLDLDGFKKVNDTLGHNIGDRILCECARRLSGCLRESDQVYRFSSEFDAGQAGHEDLFRFGGDEFIILLTRLAQSTDAGVVAQKIIDSIRQPFKVAGNKKLSKIGIGVSIGIALIPENGTDAMTLIRSADVAMYNAKELGNRYLFFNSELNQKATERVHLETGLRNALEADQFELFYQPIVNAYGAIEGAEALLRWRDAGEFIPPGRFIPIAEDTGLILPLGDWVLEQACKDLKRWNKAGHPEFYVSVNLSVKQFAQENMVRKLSEVIERAGVDPKNLKIEITETTLMRDPPQARKKMEQIKQMHPGITIAIDDFGTGYSSLSYLSDFPVDLLKIDRSFVMNLKKEQGARIVNTIIALARNLSMDVVAEGVETVEQYRYLSSRGCRFFQGFYFGKPVSAKEMTRLLKERLPALPPPQGESSG